MNYDKRKLNDVQLKRYEELDQQFVSFRQGFSFRPPESDQKEYDELLTRMKVGGRCISKKRPTTHRRRSSKHKVRKARTTRRR